MGCSTKNCTILVVEDETLIRVDAVGVFEGGGYAVLDAADSSEALQLMENKADIWMLFSDIDMPGPQDGLALAHEVRRRYPFAHIILTSGKALPFGRDMPPGAQFLWKPYWIDAISLMIDELYVRDHTPLAAA